MRTLLTMALVFATMATVMCLASGKVVVDQGCVTSHIQPEQTRTWCP